MRWRLLLLFLISPLWGSEVITDPIPPKEKRTVDGEMLVKWDETYYFDTESQPFTGRALSKFPNGQPRYDANIVNGKPHGIVTIYHNNGQALFAAPYRKGIQQGVEKNWHPDGQLQFSINYENGRRHGKMTSWRRDGSRQMDIFFVQGKIHGPFIVYEEDGQKSAHRIYHEGKLVFTRKTAQFEASPKTFQNKTYSKIISKEQYLPAQLNNPGYPKRKNGDGQTSLLLTPDKRIKLASHLWLNTTASPPYEIDFEYQAKPGRVSGKGFGSAAMAIHFCAENQPSEHPDTKDSTALIPNTGGYALQLATNGRRKGIRLLDKEGQSLVNSNENPTTLGDQWRHLRLIVGKYSIVVTLDGQNVIEFQQPTYSLNGKLIAIAAANGKLPALHSIRNLNLQVKAKPTPENISQPLHANPDFDEHKIDVRTIGFSHLEKKANDLHYELGIEKPFSGKTIDYYQSGMLKLETHYENGHRHGVHSLWYPDGTIAIQTIYDQGHPCVEIKWDAEGKNLP